jgi:hypothetical protein
MAHLANIIYGKHFLFFLVSSHFHRNCVRIVIDVKRMSLEDRRYGNIPQECLELKKSTKATELELSECLLIAA